MFFPMHPRILLATRAQCWLVANLLYLFVQVVDKLTKTGPSRDAGGDTAGSRPPTRLSAAGHSPVSSALQPGLNPPRCLPVCPTCSKLLLKDVVGDSVEAIAFAGMEVRLAGL